jgi:hypothetical protein
MKAICWTQIDIREITIQANGSLTLKIPAILRLNNNNILTLAIFLLLETLTLN